MVAPLSFNVAAERLARELEGRLFGVYALRWSAGWTFAAGALVGGWRLSLGVCPPAMVLLATVLVLAGGLIGAALAARRTRPPLPKILALLDAANSAGGLVAAAAAGADLAGWALPTVVQQPRITCGWQRPAKLAGAGAVFLLGCFLLPVPADAVLAPHRLNVDKTVAELRQQLEALEKEQLVREDELAKWREQLENIVKEASGRDPVKTWEALDYLKEAITDRTAEALKGAEELNIALEQAKEVVETMRELAAAGAMNDSEQAKALAALADMLAKAQTDAGVSIPDELRESMERLLKGQEGISLTPEQLQKLAQLMQQAQGGLKQSLEGVTKVRLLSPEELKRMLDNLKPGEGGNCQNPKELATALINMPTAGQGGNGQGATPGIDASSLLAACENGLPGSGAATRGRGDAALTWRGNTQPGSEKFKQESLSPGGVQDLRNAQLQGISFTAAQEKTDATVTGGALSGAKAGTAQARDAVVLPRHRQAVEAYFERGGKAEGK